MPSLEASVELPNGLVKRGGGASTLRGDGRVALLKVENVS